MNTTLLLASVFSFLAVALAILGVYAGRKYISPVLRTALEAYWSQRWQEIHERLRDLEEDVSKLPRVWEEFSRDAKKGQERARWHVRRVKKELERHGFEDAEIDALDSEIRARDGAGGNGQGLLPLHDAMEEVPTPQEDPLARALRQKWGS